MPVSMPSRSRSPLIGDPSLRRYLGIAGAAAAIDLLTKDCLLYTSDAADE